MQRIEPEAGLHDFRMLTVEDKARLFFDLALPAEKLEGKERIKQELDELLMQAEPAVEQTFITFDIAM